ncbi:hypothetical protein VYU27_009011 [Nannochloropsis oceanica]
MQQQQGKSSKSMDIDGAPVAQIMEDAPAVSSKEEEMDIDALTQDEGPLPAATEGYQPQEGQWKDHCFNCFSQINPSCLLAFFVPCCALAILSKRMGYASYQTVFWGLLVLFVVTCLFGVAFIYSLAVFTITFQILLIVRAKLGLPALCGKKKDGCVAIMGDCIASFFCTPCVTARMMRHLFNYKKRWDSCIGEEEVVSFV